LSHAGGGPGFATQMRIYPEEYLGVVIMGSDTSFVVDASSRLLLPAVFETDRAGGNLAVLLAYAVWAGLVILITRGKLAYRPPIEPGV